MTGQPGTEGVAAQGQAWPLRGHPPGAARAGPDRAEGHAEIPELVLADEVSRRESSSADRRSRTTGLDPTMTLDRWDDTAKVSYDHSVWHGARGAVPRRAERPVRLRGRAATAASQQALGAPYGGLFERVLSRAVDRGTVRADVDVPTLAQVFPAIAYLQVAAQGRLVDEHDVARVVDGVLLRALGLNQRE